MSYTTNDQPHQSQIDFIYVNESGTYRPKLASDASAGNPTIKNENGANVGTFNPLAVKIAGDSSSSFGETLVAQQNPQIEAYLSSAQDNREWEIYSGQNDGYVTVGTGMAAVSIGPTVLAYSTLRTKDFLPYTPGQGVTFRFTAAFNSGVANSLQLVGPYHSEDGLGVGYNGTGFGVFHRHGRKLEIQKLTVNSGAASAGNVTITLNGQQNTVTVDEANTWDLARQIATGKTYTEDGPLGLIYQYQTQQISGDVYFLREVHGPATGSFSYGAGSTQTDATFSQFQSGANGTMDWTYQTGFSLDKLNGEGASSMIIDPGQINVYQIKYGWLGALPIKFSVAKDDSQEFIPFHLIKWTNIQDTPHLEDPRFPISYAMASAGSTTAMGLKGASAFAAIEGKSDIKHRQFSFVNEETADTTEDPIFSVLCNRYNLQTQTINRRRAFIENLTATNESTTKAATIRVYLGKANNLEDFNFEIPDNLNSVVSIDRVSSVLKKDSSLVLIAAEGIAPTSSSALKIERFLLPKEVLIVTTQTSSSTAPLIITINGFEDV